MEYNPTIGKTTLIDMRKEIVESVSLLSAIMSILAIGCALLKKLIERSHIQFTDDDVVTRHQDNYKIAIQDRSYAKIDLSSKNRRNRKISKKSNVADAKCDKRAVILFLGADVYPDKVIGVDKDASLIKRCLSGSNIFKVIAKQGVKKKDIVPLISKYKPAIVHFDGHGGGVGIAVHANNDETGLEIVTPEELKRIFNASTGHLKLAYFDACNSSTHVEMAVLSIATAIGMKAEISPSAARVFSQQFYLALEHLYSIYDSFELACGQLAMTNMAKWSEVPILKAAVGCDAKTINFTIKQ